jgi:hypothetical protein
MAVPRVSVVMAVRDDPEGALRAARSVLEQTGAELELIAVDDGSVDSTAAELTRVARSDGRLRLFSRPAEGLTRALAFGCAQARGDLIARQDAGDVSLPGRFARQLAAFDRHTEIVLASCATSCLGPGREPLHVVRGAHPGSSSAILTNETPRRVGCGPTSHGSAVFRRASYVEAGGYRLQFALAQDWDLWLRLGLRGTYFEVDEVLYERTLSLGSLTFAFHDFQGEFARLALRSALAIGRGDDDAAELAEAQALSNRAEAIRDARRRSARGRGLYHVGELLRRRGDARSLAYLRAATTERRSDWKAWIRRAQAELKFRSEAGR